MPLFIGGVADGRLMDVGDASSLLVPAWPELSLDADDWAHVGEIETTRYVAQDWKMGDSAFIVFVPEGQTLATTFARLITHYAATRRK